MFVAAGDNFNPVEHLYDAATVWSSFWGTHGAGFIAWWNGWAPDFMHLTQHVIMMFIAAAIMLVGFSYATLVRNTRVPKGFRNFLEPIVLFFRDQVVRPSIHNPHGHHGEGHGHDGHHEEELPEHWLADKFVPFFVCMFCFIALLNLIGLIPGSKTATSSIFVTVSLALITLSVYIVGGFVMSIRAEGSVIGGIFGFFKNLVPYQFSWKPMDLMVWVLLFFIEFAGYIFIKPFALAVRLFANMTAGHCSLLSFLFINLLIPHDAAAWRIATGIPTVMMGVALYALEIFVAILQAYIFTYLSAIFLGMYLVPEH